MTLDSIIVCATSEYELKRLLKEGGEVWQHVGQRGEGKLRWQHTLVKVPVAIALRLGLIAGGPKLKVGSTAPSLAEVSAQPSLPAPSVRTRVPRLTKPAAGA